MIKADFVVGENGFYGFSVSGHAEGDYGRNIVCAGVSSAVMLTINTITDYFKAESKIRIVENKAGLVLKKYCEKSSKLIESLAGHLEAIGKKGDITIRIRYKL